MTEEEKKIKIKEYRRKFEELHPEARHRYYAQRQRRLRTVNPDYGFKYRYIAAKGDEVLVFHKLVDIAEYFGLKYSTLWYRFHANVKVQGYRIKRERL